MLRGINVSGQKIIKMKNLRASFEGLGFERVRSYVQSGNVIFDCAKTPSSNLSGSIKERISIDFGFSVPLVLRTSDEMEEIVDDNPFLQDKRIDRSKLHVTFLSSFPAKAGLGRLDALTMNSDQFNVHGREIYLHCPNGYGRTKLSNTVIEKLLSVEATTRNWKTVNTLARMSLE